MLFRLACLLVLLALPVPPAQSAPAVPPVRVALAVDAPAARLGGAGGLTVKTPEGRVLRRVGESVRLEAAGGQVCVEGRPAGVSVLLVPARGTVRFGGRSYRGHAAAVAGPRGLTLVDVIPLEQYLVGVLGGEIPPEWPLETQKALAVAARTYVLYQVNRTVDDDGSPRDPRFDVHPSVKDQVFLGVDGESASSRAAVRSTRGRILTLDGSSPLKAYYSAWCGGHTSDSLPVFGDRVPRLVGVPDPWCQGEDWSQVFTVEGLRRKVAPALGPVARLGPVSRDASGRIAEFRLVDRQGEEVRLTGHRLRMLLGPSAMRSTKATMTVRAEGPTRLPLLVTFRGKGWGHGVGLCQWGSAGMGEAGRTFEEILRHYYPQARLVRLAQDP